MGKNQLVAKVMELVERYKEATQDQKIRSEVVMLVGATGAGKSSLLSYINEVPLEAFSRDRGQTYQLRVALGATPLPGVEIGHDASCTRHPVVYSPDNKGFSYIDMPGFGDTGDCKTDSESKVAQDIANAYFRHAITTKSTGFKLVLVLNYDSLHDRASTTLPRSLRDLARFMQAINSTDPNVLENIKHATSIVVTKIRDTNTEDKQKIESLKEDINLFFQVNNPSAALLAKLKRKQAELTALENKAKDFVMEIACSRLNNFIENFPGLTNEMRNFLRDVVKRGQFATFTTPTQPGIKIAGDEADRILDLIENHTRFVSVRDAKIGIKVSEENEGHVFREIKDSFSEIPKELSENIDEHIVKILKTAFEGGSRIIEKIQHIDRELGLIRNYPAPAPLRKFMNFMYGALSMSETTVAFNKCEEFYFFLEFLVNLLPSRDHKEYFEKNWVQKLGVAHILDKHLATVSELLRAPQVELGKKGTLIIRGYHIRTSQLIEQFNEEKNKIENIEIQSLHTIVIDSDLRLEGVNVSMVAPRVIVSDNRVIDLSGSNGAAPNLPKADNGNNGGDGAPVAISTAGKDGTPGNSGTNGVPGGSGGNAGNFFIVCDEFSNRERLSVRLNGGNGAKGQDGGNGGNGGNGSGVTWHPFGWRGGNRTGWTALSEPVPIGSGCNQDLALLGGDGGVGGNGGQPGQGGFAGRGGECYIVVANQLINLGQQLNATQGQAGADGTPGQPGSGGVHASHAKGTWHWGKKNGESWYVDGVPARDYPHHDSHPNRGSAATGSVIRALCNASASQEIAQQNFSTILLNYKAFLAQKASEHLEIVGEFLSAFNKHCENLQSSDLLRMSINDILAETTTLEDYDAQFRREDQFIDLAPFYYSVLDRIKKLALAENRTPQELKILEYLYVAMLGKVASINAAADNLLIIDIKTYVKNLSRNFANLKEWKADRLREYYREQYQEGIEVKIEEARGFLERLSQDIQERQKEIKPAIEALEKEVEETQMAGRAEASALEQKKQQLKKALKNSKQLRIFSFAVQGLGMLVPPYGSMIAGVVDAGMNMAANPSSETVANFAAQAVNMTAKAIDMKEKMSASSSRQTTRYEANLLKKVKEMAEMVSPFIGAVVGLLDEQKAGKAQLKQLDSQIKQINAYIAKLDVYLRNVTPALEHYLQETVQEVGDFQSALENKSLVALEFSRLQINRFFASMKQNISTVLGGFETQADFGGIATRMNEALDVSVNICVRIQDYKDHMEFANYIAHLHTPRMDYMGVEPYYESHIKKLNNLIKENVVREAYARAVSAVRQWGFPFAEKFLSAIPNLNALDYETMAHNLPLIQERLVEYSASITAMDQSISRSIFESSLSRPFFTWSYDEYSKKIESLLKGKKVSFTASAESAPWDAVKFNKVGIRLRCGNAQQGELDNFLQQNFEVTLEHSGMSYYKYAENVYQIAIDKPITIRHSFNMRTDNITPVSYNRVWEKMALGDISLSPYTTWSIKMKPKQSSMESRRSVNLFDKFRTVISGFKVDVDLVGEGSYVDSKRVNKDLLCLNHYHRQVSLQKLSKTHSVPSAPHDFRPSEEMRNTQMPRINVHYQYEDNDIQAILVARLQELREQIPQRRFVPPIEILAAVDNIADSQLENRLRQAVRPNAGARIVLISCNLGNAHWVGILIEFASSGTVLRAQYIGSLASDDTVPKTFRDQLRKIYPAAIFTTYKLLQQNDSTSCGAYAIENLLSIALDIQPSQTTSEAIRNVHLEALRQYNLGFYTDFNDRQRNNRPSTATANFYTSLGLDSSKNSLSKQQLNRVLQIKQCLSNLPKSSQDPLLKAFQYKPDYEEVKLHYEEIRKALKVEVEKLGSKDLAELINLLFENWVPNASLDNLKYRVDYEEILAVTKRVLAPEEINNLQKDVAEQIKQDVEFARKLQAKLWDDSDEVPNSHKKTDTSYSYCSSRR